MRRRLPNLILGSAMLITGLAMVMPYALGHLRSTATRGTLRAVYPQESGDGRMRLVIRFEFPVGKGPFARADAEVTCLGTGLCDASGQPVDDPVLEATAAGRLAQHLEDEIDVEDQFLVYYNDADPGGSARMLLGEGGVWRQDLGIVLVLTPLAVWLVAAIAGRVNRSSMNPGRPKDVSSGDRRTEGPDGQGR